MLPPPLLLAFLLPLLHTQLLLCPASTNTNCLPCPRQCTTCSTSTSCSICSIEYHLSSSTCISCPANCQTCSSSTICTVCSNPYVLVNGTCSRCTVLNAVSCSSTIAASACNSGYYLNSGACFSCLLNCNSCSSASDCSSCTSGYYLNASILTCNPCPTGCATCDQYTPTNCLTCNNGYQLQSQSCTLATCSIANCLHCGSSTTCQQCQQYYYYNGSHCLPGASFTCTAGATGPLPNNCINSCSVYGYLANRINGTFECRMYSDVYVYPVEYHQKYYYAWNHLTEINSLMGSGQTLVGVGSGQWGVGWSGQMKWSSLPNYYRITIAIKYVSSGAIGLTISATTPSTTQTQTSVLPSSSSSPASTAITTSVVHSSNLALTANSSLTLIELSLTLSRCSSGCQICLNQQFCQLCDTPNYMLNYACVANCSAYVHYTPNMSCLTACPNGYHQVSTNGSQFCTACVSPCSTCANSSFCLSCLTGFFYYNFSCPTVCPSGYYPDAAGNTCKTCISPCKTCTSSSVCLTCSLGYWNGSHCSSSCPSGQYADSTSNACTSCSSTCLTCINSASTCTSCNSSLLFYNSQCLTTCPSRFYPSNGSCNQCQPPCYTCNNASFCLSCSYNYLLNGSCQSTCPVGYYPDSAMLTCGLCQSQCKTCTSAYTCTACTTGCLYSGACPSSCPSSSFFPVTNNNSQCSCQGCLYPCSTCSSSSICLSCVDGFLFNGTCQATCPSTYFSNSTSGLCQSCSSGYPNCINCTSSGCTLCSSNYYLLSGSCLTACPALYYTALNQCVLCNAPCLTCTDASTCLSCVSPYVLSSTSCLLECATGQLALVVANISQCVACTSPCLSCSGSQTNCTYCLFGFYLHNNQCLSNCSAITPITTYYPQASTLACKSCSFPCSTCLSQTQCLSCAVGYFNPSTFTCTQCSLGTYPLNATCVTCPSSCSICYSDTYCTACAMNYFLYLNACTNNATLCQVNGYYVSGQICYACLQPCATCMSTATNCTTCLSGYIFFSPNSCLIDCPAGYYRTNNTCLVCASQCATCITASNYCLTCSSNYFLLVSSSSCVTVCPSGTFQTGSACSSCQYPCSTCSSEVVCLSCITGVLIGSQCYSSCLSGYYPSNNTCLQCSSPCSQCSVTSTNCTQCISTHLLLGNTCISSCPATYFPESQSKQCLQCVGLCLECSSYINCTTCNSSLIYFQSASTNLGECLSSCPATYYLSNNSCLQCMTSCSSCSNATACLTCSGSLVQLSGQCLSACPSGMYSLAGICTNCSLPCANCTDAHTCTSCPTNYLLVGGSSCMLGPLCPSGYYLLTNSTRCDSKCPTNQYNLVNGTCSNLSCGGSHFMGADMFCYSTCPTGYIANRTYHCVACNGCTGLTFSLTYKIVKDSLYLYLSFTEAPEYVFTPPGLTLSPAVPYQSVNFPQQLVGGNGFTGSTNLTFMLKPTSSLTATYLTVSFQNQLATFHNPLQVASSTVYIQGFDNYPVLPDLSKLGIFALFVALIGIAKNPYMMDFAQTLFLVGLVNFHYPRHLASFLQSTAIAHLHGLVAIDQPESLGQGKFMYLTGVGFLSNTLTNLVIVAIVLGVSLLVYLVFAVVRKRLNYSKVQDESQQEQSAQDIKDQQPCLLTSLTAFFEHYKLRIFNRLLYFNYSIISLFALVQLAHFSTSPTINVLSSTLALVTLLLLIYYPLHLRTDKPKYTFLYIRKLLISGAVVLSVKDAIYAIGVISVCNLTAAILLLTYKLEKYRGQTRFLAGCEIAQLFIQGCLSFFIMIGEGYSTESKVTLCWAIVIAMVLLLLAYFVQAIVQVVCYICLKRDKDLRENWVLNGQEEEQSSHHSESINGSMKEVKSQKAKEDEQKEGNRVNFNEDKFEEMLVEMHEQMREKIEEELAQDSRIYKTLSRSPDKKGVFWAYSESQIDDKENHPPQIQPPRMLVRCVNEFSEVDPAEEEDRNVQKDREKDKKQ